MPRKECPVSSFQSRGVVVGPLRFLIDWPERAAKLGLTTIALHGHPHQDSTDILTFVASEQGQAFIKSCRILGIAVEYELHAMNYLLPRRLFECNPELFRMDDHGKRTPEGNFCLQSDDAWEIILDRAIDLAKQLPPTTHRYFLWPDDGPPWCRCPKCRTYSDSDQSLVLTNAIAKRLQKAVDSQAQIAHLAYHNTLDAPKVVTPGPGVFLEFAPIRRVHEIPMDADHETQHIYVKALEENLKLFPADQAQVLEYWLDVSWFSNYTQPPKKLPFSREVLAADLDFYASLGIGHITTFGVDIDQDYLDLHGEPPLDEYANELCKGRTSKGGTERSA